MFIAVDECTVFPSLPPEEEEKEGKNKVFLVDMKVRFIQDAQKTLEKAYLQDEKHTSWS